MGFYPGFFLKYGIKKKKNGEKRQKNGQKPFGFFSFKIS